MRRFITTHNSPSSHPEDTLTRSRRSSTDHNVALYVKPRCTQVSLKFSDCKTSPRCRAWSCEANPFVEDGSLPGTTFLENSKQIWPQTDKQSLCTPCLRSDFKRRQRNLVRQRPRPSCHRLRNCRHYAFIKRPATTNPIAPEKPALIKGHLCPARLLQEAGQSSSGAFF